MMSFNNILLNYIWHGFHDQYGIPNRFSFLFIFVLLTMGYEAVIKTDRKQIPGVLAGIIAAFGFLVYAKRISILTRRSSCSHGFFLSPILS